MRVAGSLAPLVHPEYPGVEWRLPALTFIARSIDELDTQDSGPEAPRAIRIVGRKLDEVYRRIHAPHDTLKLPGTKEETEMHATQRELADRFRALHEGPGFVMPNSWDGLSAAIFAQAGFEATATSSAALAFSLGRADGRHEVTCDEHLEHAQLLHDASGLPVNGDFEDGYGDIPEDVGLTVKAAIAAGLAGIGIEDTSGNPEAPIRPFDEAVARVKAAVEAANGRIVVTGRTDNFLHGRPDLDDTIRRLQAFAEVGADVLYAPLLPTQDAIGAVVTAVTPKPINVLIGPSDAVLTAEELFAIGVRRISLGGSPYLYAMKALAELAARVRTGEVAVAGTGLPFGEALELIARAG
jgi:2-methylisocitrate lyase-like PEP mutase family enzyme